MAESVPFSWGQEQHTCHTSIWLQMGCPAPHAPPRVTLPNHVVQRSKWLAWRNSTRSGCMWAAGLLLLHWGSPYARRQSCPAQSSRASKLILAHSISFQEPPSECLASPWVSPQHCDLYDTESAGSQRPSCSHTHVHTCMRTHTHTHTEHKLQKWSLPHFPSLGQPSALSPPLLAAGLALGERQATLEWYGNHPQTLASLRDLELVPNQIQSALFSPYAAASSWAPSHTVEPSEWGAPDKPHEGPAPPKGPRERRRGREGNAARPGTAATLSLLLTEAFPCTEKDFGPKHKFTRQGSDPAGPLGPDPELLETEHVQPLPQCLAQKAPNPPGLSD